MGGTFVLGDVASHGLLRNVVLDFPGNDDIGLSLSADAWQAGCKAFKNA